MKAMATAISSAAADCELIVMSAQGCELRGLWIAGLQPEWEWRMCAEMTSSPVVQFEVARFRPGATSAADQRPGHLVLWIFQATLY